MVQKLKLGLHLIIKRLGLCMPNILYIYIYKYIKPAPLTPNNPKI